MEKNAVLSFLNDRQYQAVTAPLGNFLVLAGAGSGKTRVLTERIAWLIRQEGIAERSILAVTFTNKAAGEMRERIAKSLNVGNLYGMWVGTFHSIANRILRTYFEEAKLPQDFQIIDTEDQYRLIKKLIKLHQYDEKEIDHKEVCWFINNEKDYARRPPVFNASPRNKDETFSQLYRLYQDACDRSGLVDFGELLLRSYELLKQNSAILLHFHQRFNQILVDEFQDTNFIQYEWIKLLASKNGNVMIVGDDDQSIYGWRGAKVENLQQFIKDFPRVETIRLEQNYRSTGHILTAANELIAQNTERMGKKLWTSGEMGKPIEVYEAFNDLDEALFVTSQIEEWQERGEALNECAVLYRNNSLSRVIEDALVRKKIPYRIYGGLRFFERQEIKDSLAYLRLASNPNDDAAFERVINTPTRGIGERTLEVLRQITRDQQTTLWQALHLAINENYLPTRASTMLLRFAELIQHMSQTTLEMKLFEQLDYVVKHSGLYDMYKKEKGDKGETRIENIEELVNAAKFFTKAPEDEEMTELQAFLSYASLEAGEKQAEAFQDCVQLMTLHAAKGLEFSRVFIVGMEEGIFPNARTSVDLERLEEDRRLAYVGITRAKEELTLTHAEKRRLYGREERHRRSRFIMELPKENQQEIRLRGQITRPAQTLPTTPKRSTNPLIDNKDGWQLGQKVMHAKFGEGCIINKEGGGDYLRLQVAFYNNDAGIKWLQAKMAKLEKI